MRLGDFLRSHPEARRSGVEASKGSPAPAETPAQGAGGAKELEQEAEARDGGVGLAGKGRPSDGEERVVLLPINEIRRGTWQPRHEFDEEDLEQLARSIAAQGLVSPVLVRPWSGGGYELVAGERRFRACQRLGWTHIPAVVRQLSDQAAAEGALVENVQRADLHFLEEARAYRRLMEEFGLTQEQVAARVGKSQPAVANRLRLLRLSERVQEAICQAGLGERQARALLALESEEAQLAMVEQIERDHLSSEQVEKIVGSRRTRARKAGRRSTGAQDGEGRHIIRWLQDLRPFRNSLRELVAALRQTGVTVELEESQSDQEYRAVIRVDHGQPGTQVSRQEERQSIG